ncbi:hypothetical protein AB0395_44675 [Streptosporangium sp. NPDC051023]|uniref:effector-associated constant component EACC1 n=1 Tax=Streptosporangium sp. NPDC051023 TaxID=3155410 RepID=UPI00344C6CA4
MTISGNEVADLLRDLHSWMSEESDLRGRVRIREAAIPAGALGAPLDALQLILGAGGGAATAASVLIAWLSNRSGEVGVKLTRGGEDGETLEVTAKGVKDLNPAQLRELTTHITHLFETTDPDE